MNYGLGWNFSIKIKLNHILASHLKPLYNGIYATLYLISCHSIPRFLSKNSKQMSLECCNSLTELQELETPPADRPFLT